MQLGAVVIRAALARAGVEAGEVSDVILGQVLTAGQGQNPARQAAIKAGLPIETPAITINQVCGSGLRAVAMGCQAIAGGRRRRGGGGRAGEHEPGDALRLSARRGQDGQRRAGRHDDQGRAVGRVQRLPHGDHGRERGAEVADHPRAAGRVRGRLAGQGGGGAGGGAVQGRDRAGDGQGPQGRGGGRPGRVPQGRHHGRERWPSCGRRSARTGRSPPATRRG